MIVRLQDGVYVAESSYEEKDIVKEAGFTWTRLVERKWATKDPRFAYKLYAYCDESTKAALDAWKKTQEVSLSASRATDAAIDTPAPEGLEYLPYQRGGIAFAISRSGILFGDEMGLGKTIQLLGVINGDPDMLRILIVCPASLKLNWAREANKWLVNRELAKAIRVLDGSSIVYPQDGLRFYICNFDILHKFEKAFRSCEWDLLGVDEAHFMKNPKARRTKMVLGYKPRRGDEAKAVEPIKARRRLFLTGTPIVNRPVELWPLVSSLDPVTFPDFFQYAKRYCAAEQTKYGWDFSGASNLDELQERLRASIMVRRLKADVLKELPPKRRQVIELAANGAAGAVNAERTAWARHQDRLVELRVAVELAKASETKEEYAAAVKALRDGLSESFSEMSKTRHAVALAKVPAVVEHVKDAIDENPGYKIVLFAHHVDVVDKLMAAFGSKAVRLTGDTSIPDRQNAVDRFQTDPSVQVFIGNIQAAGVGITLTASSHVVFAELDWVPGNVSQAEDRLHRIGQVNSVLVQHLVLEGSLDAVMATTIVDKQAVIDKALDDPTEGAMFKTMPLLPVVEKPATERVSFERIKKEVVENPMAPEQVAAIHLGLQMLAGVCDGALSLDGMGFNKFDSRIGKSLASAPRLSMSQALLGQRLVRKYRRQLPQNIIDAAQVAAKAKEKEEVHS